MTILTIISTAAATLLGYVYVGYPALLWLLARRRPARVYRSDLPTLTLIIAAYNEEAVIGTKLEETLTLDYPGDLLEILVVTDGSDDGTVEIVRTFAGRGVQLCHEPARRGKAKAVDRALQLASGEIAVLSDANNSYTTGSLRALVAPFADPAVGLVCGAKLTGAGAPGLDTSEGIYWRYEAFIKAQESRLGSCTGVSGEIMAVRRSIAKPLPEHTILDDLDRLLQVLGDGYEARYAPGAVSVESTAATLDAELIRRRRMTAGRWLLVADLFRRPPRLRLVVWWQLISHKVLRLALPFAMTICALFAVLDWFERRRRRRGTRLNDALAGLNAAFYVLAWLAPKLPLRGPAKALYVPRYLVATNLATVQGLFLAGREREMVVWEKVPRFELSSARSEEPEGLTSDQSRSDR